VVRGSRASVRRASLSSCTAAEAVADGLERGMTAEQVFAIRQVWNFEGSEQILADWEEKKPYRVALRSDKGDPTLASRYKSDEAGGNIVREKIAQVREYSEDPEAARLEVHTLKFRPPSRRRVKMEIPPSESEEDSDEDGREDGSEDEEDAAVEEGEQGEDADASSESAVEEEEEAESSSSESLAASHSHKTGLSSALDDGILETHLTSLVSTHELAQIPDLDADEIRAAVQRAKEMPEYHAAHNSTTHHCKENETTQEAEGKETRVVVPEGKQINVCTIFPWR